MITNDILEQIDLIEQDIEFCSNRIKESNEQEYLFRIENNRKELERLKTLFSCLRGDELYKEEDMKEYTARKLYKELVPIQIEKYNAQMTGDGLSVNLSDMFSTLIKDAARCNGYQSDVYYSMCEINSRMKNYKPLDDFEPIFVAFRKLGVDGNNYILSRINDTNVSVRITLSREYFALYSIALEEDIPGWYNVIFSKYGV